MHSDSTVNSNIELSLEFLIQEILEYFRENSGECK